MESQVYQVHARRKHLKHRRITESFLDWNGKGQPKEYPVFVVNRELCLGRFAGFVQHHKVALIVFNICDNGLPSEGEEGEED